MASINGNLSRSFNVSVRFGFVLKCVFSIEDSELAKEGELDFRKFEFELI